MSKSSGFASPTGYSAEAFLFINPLSPSLLGGIVQLLTDYFGGEGTQGKIAWGGKLVW